MAWLAVGIKGTEWVFSGKPKRTTLNAWGINSWDNAVILPKGTIKKLIGCNLQWENDPVELK